MKAPSRLLPMMTLQRHESLIGARKARNSHSSNGSQVKDGSGNAEGRIGKIDAVTRGLGQGICREAEDNERKEVGRP